MSHYEVSLTWVENFEFLGYRHFHYFPIRLYFLEGLQLDRNDSTVAVDASFVNTFAATVRDDAFECLATQQGYLNWVGMSY